MKFGAIFNLLKKMEPVVRVKQGQLKGSIGTLLDGRQKYFSFKGIPYATPPVGDLRFKAPLPPKNWEGVREAMDHGPVCPQFNMSTNQATEGNEDCLYLNVYTQHLKAKAPVMVYIHGGAYMSGSGDEDLYGPHFLIQHDVVLVTINYRLEVLGFLCLDTPEVPGNAGMKDQVLALKWVKENIEQFGGDPNNVTIFGESAGAASVAYHMLSPMSKGLFHKAIAQSGTCLDYWAIANQPLARAFRVAKFLGKETNDTKELLDFLKTVPAVDLTKLTFKVRTQDERYRGIPMHFVPNVEKKFDNVEAFLTEETTDLVLSKKVNEVPFMIGYNSGEGFVTLLDQLKKTEFFNKQPSYLIPRDIVEKVSETKAKEFGERVLEFYTGGKGLNGDAPAAIVDIQTDVNFAYQTHRFAHFYSKCNVPVYMYKFEYDTDLNILKNLLGCKDMKGASHADDLFYIFSTVMGKELYMEQEKLRNIVDNLTKLWTNFAKAGNPTPKDASSALPHWPPYTSGKGDFMCLNEVMSAGRHADGERVEFWNTMYRDAGLPYIAKSNL